MAEAVTPINPKKSIKAVIAKEVNDIKSKKADEIKGTK